MSQLEIKTPTWEKYYLNIAREVARKCKCYRAMYGAIIVKDNEIISTGYIGAPRKTKDCLERNNCLRNELKVPRGQRYELCRSVHSEQNAIINAARAGVSLLDGDMYIYGEGISQDGARELLDIMPCSFCKRMIINAGLKRIICSKKDNGINIFHIDDWVRDWQTGDIVDDVHQHGEGLKVYQLGEDPVENQLNPQNNSSDNSFSNNISAEAADKDYSERKNNDWVKLGSYLSAQNIGAGDQISNVSKKIILAVVGMPGSGKTEVSRYIESQGFKKVYFGQVTFDEIQRRGLETNEANEKIVREDLRRQYGAAAFAILGLPKVKEYYDVGQNVVIESLYSWDEYLTIKQKFGDKFKVIAVHSSPELRYARVMNRVEVKNGVERQFTRSDVENRDKNQLENLATGGPIAMADYVIINSGTLEELYKEVDEVIEQVVER